MRWWYSASRFPFTLALVLVIATCFYACGDQPEEFVGTIAGGDTGTDGGTGSDSDSDSDADTDSDADSDSDGDSDGDADADSDGDSDADADTDADADADGDGDADADADGDKDTSTDTGVQKTCKQAVSCMTLNPTNTEACLDGLSESDRKLASTYRQCFIIKCLPKLTMVPFLITTCPQNECSVELQACLNSTP